VLVAGTSAVTAVLVIAVAVALADVQPEMHRIDP
jgi:hypothetical protein